MSRSEIEKKATVYIVDDDQRTRRQIMSLVNDMDMSYQELDSAESLFQIEKLERPGCIVANGFAQGSIGIEIHERLVSEPTGVPLILTGHDLDVTTAICLMEQRAFTLLVKPYLDTRLREALKEAIRCDSEWLTIVRRHEELLQYERDLSDKELTVLEWLMQGARNKVIAREMDLSVRMVETHRANLRRKLCVNSACEAVANYSELRVLSDTVFRIDSASDTRIRKSTMRLHCGRR